MEEMRFIKFDPDYPSIYARVFNESSRSWCNDPEYNKVFIDSMVSRCNDLLKTRGHLFLNEVYDIFGLERSKVGALVGWIIAEGCQNFVTFGDWVVNPDDGSILLNFNIDGLIFDKI